MIWEVPNCSAQGPAHTPHGVRCPQEQLVAGRGASAHARGGGWLRWCAGRGWPGVFLQLPFLVKDEVLGQFILGSVL